ncbi:MAG: haloacid dehalogenase type II [Sedimentitalea sp.]
MPDLNSLGCILVNVMDCPAAVAKGQNGMLSNFKAMVFDVYGTLIDWESGMIAGLEPLTRQVSQNLGRDDILEAHAFYESTLQRWSPQKPYCALLASVYRRLAEEWGVEVEWADCLTYGASVQHWPAFPDSKEALIYLKQHFLLMVLTNTDNDSFAHSNARLGVTFDGVYTAQDVGSYKPDPRNFRFLDEMLVRRGIAKSDVLHVAESLFHDHVPGNAAGLSNCWVYRRHDQQGFGATMDPGQMPRIDMKFNSMADMVAAHRKAQTT